MKEKDKIRVSFDVPIEEHTFLKIECAKAHIALRDLMKDVFHKTVQDLKKKQLNSMLLQGFEESYEGKTSSLTDEELTKLNDLLND